MTERRECATCKHSQPPAMPKYFDDPERWLCGVRLRVVEDGWCPVTGSRTSRTEGDAMFCVEHNPDGQCADWSKGCRRRALPPAIQSRSPSPQPVGGYEPPPVGLWFVVAVAIGLFALAAVAAAVEPVRDGQGQR